MSFSHNAEITIDEMVNDLFTNPEDHPEDYVNGEYVGPFPEEQAQVAHLYSNKSIRYFEDSKEFVEYYNQIATERNIRSNDNLYEGKHEGRKTLVFRISLTEEAVLILPENATVVSIAKQPEPEPEEEEEEFLELPLETEPEEPLRPYTVGFDDDTEEVPAWDSDDSEEITADTPVLEEPPTWDSDDSSDSEEPVIVQQLNHSTTTSEERTIRTYAGRMIPESFIRETLENMPRGNFDLENHTLDTDYGCIVHTLYYIHMFATGFYQLSLDERTLVVEIYLHELQNIHEDPRLQEQCTNYAHVSLRLSEDDNAAINTHSRKKIALRSTRTTRDLIYSAFESIYMLPVRNVSADIRVPENGIFKCNARNVARDAGISADYVEDFNRTGSFEDAILVMYPTSEEISYLYRISGDSSRVITDEIVMYYNMMQQHLKFQNSLLIDRSVHAFMRAYDIKFSVRTTGAIQ